MTNTSTTWAARFSHWKTFADQIQARAERVAQARRDRAWALAATVGIPRHGCCLHNASIDTDLRGWCHGNPERLRVAKRAVYLLDQSFEPTRLADRIIRRAYPK